MPTSSSTSIAVDLGEAADLTAPLLQRPSLTMAMPTSSSDSIVVDLGEAADLDDATSRLFFSDISDAGVSWPAVSEIDSTLKSQDLLVALCSKHGVPSELTPVCAEHLGWRACTPPPVGSNRMCVYADALHAGLSFPLHGFYVRVLRHYRLAPSQLTPNSWTCLAAFVLRCQDADVEPLVAAFRYFFTICAHTREGKPTGYHHFQQNNHDVSRRLFTGTGALPSWNGWKSRFFFLDCPSGWKCPVKWGKPRRKDARRAQLTSTASVIEKLKAKGCIDIKPFLANREMPVGDPATLSPLQSVAKMEAGAAKPTAAAAGGAGPSAAAAGVAAAAGGAGPCAAAAGVAAENASRRKRRRLSPAAVFSQPQLLPTSAPAGLAPMRASSTGGSSAHIPPPGLAPIRASSTGDSWHFLPPQQQSLGESASSLRELPGMRVRAQSVSIGGSGEVTMPAPHTMCASDALQLWEALHKVSKQEAMIAKLNENLRVVITWKNQWQQELMATKDNHKAEIAEIIAEANDRNNHLYEVIDRLDKERDQLIRHLHTASLEVAQLKAEHATERAQLKEELAAEAKQAQEELMENLEQLKHECYTRGASDMKDLAHSMYKDVINPDELKVELLLECIHQGASPVAAEDQ